MKIYFQKSYMDGNIHITFGISIAISMLVPFPISLVIIMGVFILLNLYMRNRMMRRMGSGMLFGSMSSMPGCNSVRYYCMSCSMQHKEAAFPKCLGSCPKHALN